MPAATSRSVRRMAGTSGGEPRPQGLCRNHPFSTATRGWKQGGRGWARGARGNHRAEASQGRLGGGWCGRAMTASAPQQGQRHQHIPTIVHDMRERACNARRINADDAFQPTPTPNHNPPCLVLQQLPHGVEHSPPPRPPHNTHPLPPPPHPRPHPPASMSVPRLQCCCTMYTLPRSSCPPFTSMRLTISYAYVCRAGRGEVGSNLTQRGMHKDQQSCQPVLAGRLCERCTMGS